jgi:hypothetical protein
VLKHRATGVGTIVSGFAFADADCMELVVLLG